MNTKNIGTGFAVAAVITLGVLGIVGVGGYLIFRRLRDVWDQRPVATKLSLLRADGGESIIWTKPLLQKKS